MMYRNLVARQFPGSAPGPPPSPEYLAEDVGPHLIAVATGLFVITTSVILLRFYVRLAMLKIFGWDDWMMVLTLILSIILFALWIRIVNLGMGKHAEAFPMQNFPEYFKIVYFYSIMGVSAYTTIKMSIAFFLLKLADRTKWRPFLIGMQIFMLLFLLGSILPIVFQCRPIQAGWTFALRPPLGKAKCIDDNTFKNIGVMNSSVNIATDLLFAIIPIPMLWRLQVNLRTRIGLAVILGLGFFASAVSIYKTPMQFNFFKEKDWSGHGSWFNVWQFTEMYVGILAACLPTLKPLFANFFGQIRSSFGKSRGSGSAGPFKSSGYMKHSVDKPAPAFALRNLGSKGSSQNHRDPYDEDVILGKETYLATAATGERTQQRNDSEESVWGMEQRRSAMGMGIVRTTEVNVTR